MEVYAPKPTNLLYYFHTYSFRYFQLDIMESFRNGECNIISSVTQLLGVENKKKEGGGVVEGG